MHRTTLTYRVATLAVVGVLTFGWLRLAAAAEQQSSKAKPAAVAQSPAESNAPAASALPKVPKLRFQFRYQAWKDVLEWFAQKADLSLVMVSPPDGVLNYSDDREYTPVEAIDLLNDVLWTKGFTLVRRGPILMLINLSRRGSSKSTQPEGLRPAHRKPRQAMSTLRQLNRPRLRP